MPKLPNNQKHISNKKPKQDPSKSNRHHVPHDRAVNLLQSLGYGVGTTQPAEAFRDDKVGSDHGNDHDLNYNPRDNPPIPLLDSAAKSLAQAARAQFYAQKRLDFEQKWTNLAAPVTAVFLERQHATQNWTTTFSYLASQPQCQISSLQFTFCKCWPNVIQLLYAGYFASSPTEPHTAFSIPLVQFHHRLWQTSALSTSAFIDALVAFLDDRSASPLYGRLWNGMTTKCELRKPLTQSIDLYRWIPYPQELLYIEGLNLSSLDIYAQKCACCFGPREGEVKVSPKEPEVIIYGNGNFQQLHYSYARKDNPAKHEYPSSFFLPSQISKVAHLVKKTAAKGSDIKTACLDSHTAANDTCSSATWRKSCDDNGLCAFACRHDIMLKMANLYEELHYPVSILQHFLEQLPDIELCVLYDIGCHLDAHIKKQGLLPNFQTWLMFGTAVLHAYVHEWACQIVYNPRYKNYWGLYDGEGLERLWSFLSALVAVLWTSTRLHRLWALHWRCDFYNGELKSKSGQWILSKFNNALQVKDNANKGLSDLYSQRNPHNPDQEFYSAEFLKEQWTLERNAQASKKQAEDKQQLELGRLLCLEQEILQLWNTPVNTLAAEHKLSRTRRLNETQEKITAQQKKLGAKPVVAFLSRRCTFQLAHPNYIIYVTEFRSQALSMMVY
ncbi:hypothetical protein DFH28DRAFT_1127625 [Melampsora americana]|nr:hypothetical protein DFH28DRAFT_1127625 [Melampsora americana]